MKKRLVSLLLVMWMIVGMLPVSAFDALNFTGIIEIGDVDSDGKVSVAYTGDEIVSMTASIDGNSCNIVDGAVQLPNYDTHLLTVEVTAEGYLPLVSEKAVTWEAPAAEPDEEPPQYEVSIDGVSFDPWDDEYACRGGDDWEWCSNLDGFTLQLSGFDSDKPIRVIIPGKTLTLKLSGENKITVADDDGIFVDGNLTIINGMGQSSLNVISEMDHEAHAAVYVTGDLTVNGGPLIAENKTENGKAVYAGNVTLGEYIVMTGDVEDCAVFGYPAYLMVAGEEVTGENSTGAGWSYDAETNTLTLNNFHYTSEGEHESGIVYESDALGTPLTLVVRGENTITTKNADGIYIGSGGLIVSKDSTGTLTVTNERAGEYSAAIFLFECDLIVNGGTLIVENTKDGKPVYGDVVCGDGIVMTGDPNQKITVGPASGSDDGEGEDDEVTDGDTESTGIGMLWIGGEQFTEEKLTIEDGTGGTATYDPESNTLTLNGFSFEGKIEGESTNEALLKAAGIAYMGSEALNLVLTGENTITSDSMALACQSTLNISGTGSLTVEGMQAGMMAMDTTIESGSITAVGVQIMGDLTMNDGTLKAKALGTGDSEEAPPSFGLFVEENLTVNDGTLIAEGDEGVEPAYIGGEFTTGEGVEILTPVGGEFDTGYFVVADDQAVTRVVIGKAVDPDDCTIGFYVNGTPVAFDENGFYGGSVTHGNIVEFKAIKDGEDVTERIPYTFEWLAIDYDDDTSGTLLSNAPAYTVDTAEFEENSDHLALVMLIGEGEYYVVYFFPYTPKVVPVAKIGEQGYETLAAAVEAAQSGDTIVLLQDIALTADLNITKKLTLDLNGSTISVTALFEVGDGGELTVIDSTSGGTIVNATGVAIYVNAGGMLTVESGTLEGLYGGVRVNTNGKAVLKGGTLKGGAGVDGFAVYVTGTDSEVTITDNVSISSPSIGVFVTSGGTANINGGTISGQLNSVHVSGNSTVNISGGTATGLLLAQENSTVFITDGKILDQLSAVRGGSFVIEGGSFQYEPASTHIKVGFEAKQQADGMYIVSKKEAVPVAQVGAQTFTSLADAINAADATNNTVVLIAETELGENLTIGKKVTIDLGGKIITSVEPMIFVGATGDLTIIDSVGGGKINDTKGAGITLEDAGGKLNILSGTISSNQIGVYTRRGTVIIEGGAITGGQHGVLAVENGKVFITGGTVTRVTTQSGGTASVTGGSFNTDPTAYVAEGYLTAQQTNGWYTVGAPAAKIGEQGYLTLEAALEAAQSDDTVVLFKDIELSNSININKNLTLDLNDHNIHNIKDSTSDAIFVQDGGDLTITDSVGGGTISSGHYGVYVQGGTVNMEGGTITGGDGIVVSGGNVTITGGTISGTGSDGSGVWIASGTVNINGGTVSGSVYGVYAQGGTTNINGGTVTANNADGVGVWLSGGTVNINGGTVSGDGQFGYGVCVDIGTTTISGEANISGSYAGVYVSIEGDDKATISGGTITGGDGIVVSGGIVTITGGNISGTGLNGSGVWLSGGTTNINGGTVSGSVYGVYAQGGTTNINGGTVSGSVYGVYAQGGTVNINGGTFTGGISMSVQSGTCEITGGTFSDNPPMDYIAEGYAAKLNSETGMYVVSQIATADVSIAAVDAATGANVSGATLQIIESDGNGWISNGVNTIEDLPEGTYTLRATVAPDGYIIPADTSFTIDEHGNITYTGTVDENGVLLVEFANTSVSIAATDIDDGEELAGATLQIIDENGNVVDEWTSTKDSSHVTEGLKTGVEYKLKVTVAPDGYVIPAESYFTIDESGRVTSTGTMDEDGTLLVEFTKTSVTIAATDIDDGEELAGATLQILDGSGRVVDEWTSAAEEIHTVEGLKTNEEYTLKATVAPDGYTIPTDTTFTINESGRVTSTGTMDENGTLLVEFTAEKFDVKFVDHDGTELSKQTVEYGSAAVAPAAPTREGYTFTGWDKAFDNITSALTVTAQYEANKYDVEIQQPTGGNVATDNETPVKGEDVTITVTPDEGKEIDKVIVKDENGKEIPVTQNPDGSYTYEQPAGDVTVDVTMKDSEYEVEIPTVEGGKIETDNEAPVKGDDVTITVTPDEGKEIDKVIVKDENGKEIPVTQNPDGSFTYEQPAGDVTVDVTMKDSEYEVEIPTVEGGKVETDNETPVKGDDVTITVTPDEGKEIDKVIVKDENGKEIPVTQNPDGSYTYEQPAGDVTVEVVIKDATPSTPPTPPAPPAEDEEDDDDDDDYEQPTYRPSIEETEGGETSVNKKNPEKGDKVTITTNPDEGYVVDNVIVLDKNGNEVEVINNGNGTFTFKQPAGKVTIEVVYAMEEKASDFDDVAVEDYFFDAVNWAVENGITNGVGVTTFAPNATCTRAQVVTFLWRAAGSPEPKTTEMPFADIPADAYYYNAVLWAFENGITSGTSAATFGPESTVTRSQTVTFLWRAESGDELDGEHSFADVAADVYYRDAVLWAVENEITNGTSTNTFSPNSGCTRGQIVTFLYRTMAE